MGQQDISNSHSTITKLQTGLVKAIKGYYRIKDFIHAIRACKSISAERALILKESARIRTAFKRAELSLEERFHSLGKLLFILLSGYPDLAINGQVEAMKLVAHSTLLKERRIGYLGVIMLIDQSQPTLTLIVNSIKSDLNRIIGRGDQSHFIIGLALGTLATIATIDMAREFIDSVIKLVTHQNPYIRKKALLCTRKLLELVPEAIDPQDIPSIWIEGKIKPCLRDRDNAIVLNGIHLLELIATLYPDSMALIMKEEFTNSNSNFNTNSSSNSLLRSNGIIQILIDRLNSLIQNNSLHSHSHTHSSHSSNFSRGSSGMGMGRMRGMGDGDYEMSGINDPFLQVAILRIMRILTINGNPRIAEEIIDILTQLSNMLSLNSNSSNSNSTTTIISSAGKAVLYECLITILSIPIDEASKGMALEMLGRMLDVGGDPNARFVALSLIQKTLVSQKEWKEEESTSMNERINEQLEGDYEKKDYNSISISTCNSNSNFSNANNANFSNANNANNSRGKLSSTPGLRKHLSKILECLKDEDDAIRRIACQVLLELTDRDNVELIILEILETRELFINEKDLIPSIALTIGKYTPNPNWYIDTMLNLIGKIPITTTIGIVEGMEEMTNMIQDEKDNTGDQIITSFLSVLNRLDSKYHELIIEKMRECLQSPLQSNSKSLQSLQQSQSLQSLQSNSFQQSHCTCPLIVKSLIWCIGQWKSHKDLQKEWFNDPQYKESLLMALVKLSIVDEGKSWEMLRELQHDKDDDLIYFSMSGIKDQILGPIPPSLLNSTLKTRRKSRVKGEEDGMRMEKKGERNEMLIESLSPYSQSERMEKEREMGTGMDPFDRQSLNSTPTKKIDDDDIFAELAQLSLKSPIGADYSNSFLQSPSPNSSFSMRMMTKENENGEMNSQDGNERNKDSNVHSSWNHSMEREERGGTMINLENCNKNDINENYESFNLNSNLNSRSNSNSSLPVYDDNGLSICILNNDSLHWKCIFKNKLSAPIQNVYFWIKYPKWMSHDPPIFGNSMGRIIPANGTITQEIWWKDRSDCIKIKISYRPPLSDNDIECEFEYKVI